MVKKIYIYLISIFLLTGISCKSKFHIGQSTVIGNDKYKFVFDNYDLSGSSDTAKRNVFLRFENGANSKNIFMNQKGDLLSYTDCSKLGGYIQGGTYMVFKNNRLWLMYFVDSTAKKNGPFFMYKKNGKLKHIYIYKDDYCIDTFYTR